MCRIKAERFMKIKTSKLIGPALDWAVAKCEWGYHYTSNEDFIQIANRQRYSTNWSQGGLIIEREGISWHCGNKSSWHTYGYGSAENFNGPTPLIAAMRCYVASKLGDEVEVPDELTAS